MTASDGHLAVGDHVPAAADAGPVPVTHGLGGDDRHAHVARLARQQQLRDDRRQQVQGLVRHRAARVLRHRPPARARSRSPRSRRTAVSGANSLERCSAVQTSCTHDLVVTIGVKGNLANASSVSDPIVAMRVAGGSQNQSLDCDPAVSNLKEELATGCRPTYSRNTGTTACPERGRDVVGHRRSRGHCVAVQTGRRGEPGAGRLEPADHGRGQADLLHGAEQLEPVPRRFRKTTRGSSRCS